MLIGSVFLVREIDGAPPPAREETNTLCFGNDPGFCQPGMYCVKTKEISEKGYFCEISNKISKGL